MSAEIIEFFEARARHSERASGIFRSGSTSASNTPGFMFWEGCSGTRYVHTVHSLVACPELPPCTYVLVGHGASGERQALAVGQLTRSVPSLNLAELRHRGARIGENEIHVHLLAGSPPERNRVVLDLKAAVAPETLVGKFASARS